MLNFVLENFRKIRHRYFNFQLDLAILVTNTHIHARYTGFHAHKHSLISTSTRATSLTLNCVTVASIGRIFKKIFQAIDFIENRNMPQELLYA